MTTISQFDKVVKELDLILPPLLFSNKTWRFYNDSCWQVLSEELTKQVVYEAVLSAFPRVSIAKFGVFFELLKAKKAIDHSLWDKATEGKIPFRNGCLSLPDFSLIQHKKEDYLTEVLPIDYSDNSQIRGWQEYLDNMPESALGILQQYAAYCLLGHNRYEKMLWLYGPPGSGKSIYITAIAQMLGNKADLFHLEHLNGTYGLNNVQGKTLLYSTEVEHGTFVSTGVLNALVSGEPVTVNIKYVPQFTVVSRAKVIIATNHPPKLASALSDGISRRLVFLELPEVKPIPGLKERALSDKEGFLTWVLEGLKKITANNGLVIENTIEARTKEYLAANDVIGSFVAEYLIKDTPYATQATKLYFTYKNYCKDNGYIPLAMNNFSQELKRLGFFNKRIAEGIVWNVELKSVAS